MAGTEEDDAGSTKDADSKINELLSMETLRESPIQWPERCKYHEVRTILMHTFLKYLRFAVPGMEEFLTASETPIHTPTIDPAQILANDNMKAINRECRSQILPQCDILKSSYSLQNSHVCRQSSWSRRSNRCTIRFISLAYASPRK